MDWVQTASFFFLLKCISSVNNKRVTDHHQQHVAFFFLLLIPTHTPTTGRQSSDRQELNRPGSPFKNILSRTDTFPAIKRMSGDDQPPVTRPTSRTEPVGVNPKSWLFHVERQRSPHQETTEKKKLFKMISPLCYSPANTTFIYRSVDWQSSDICSTLTRPCQLKYFFLYSTDHVRQSTSDNPTVRLCTGPTAWSSTVTHMHHQPDIRVPGWRLPLPEQQAAPSSEKRLQLSTNGALTDQNLLPKQEYTFSGCRKYSPDFQSDTLYFYGLCFSQFVWF